MMTEERIKYLAEEFWRMEKLGSYYRPSPEAIIRHTRTVAAEAQKEGIEAMRDAALEEFDVDDGNRAFIYQRADKLLKEDGGQHKKGVEYSDRYFEWTCPRCGAKLPSTEEHCPCEVEVQHKEGE